MALHLRTQAGGAAAGMGGGCAALFGSVFILAGVAVGFFLYFPAIQGWWSARLWEETPCWIEKVEMSGSRGSKGGTTYEVKAEYRYEFRGRAYRADRVGLTEGSDNFGDFQQRAYATLQPYENAGRPFRCLVNPQNPEQAVLFPELRWGLMLLMSLFPTLFPMAGGLVAFGGMAMAREAMRVLALKKRHPETPWKWKTEWSGNEITATRGGVAPLLAAAGWIALIQGPLAAAIVVSGEISHGLLALLGLLPCLLALLPLWLGWRRMKARRVLGAVSFLPREWPLKSGSVLAGEIRLGTHPSPLTMLTVRAHCTRRVTRGSGKHSSTSHEVLWEHTQTISAAEARRDGHGSSILLRIDIPHGLPSVDVEPVVRLAGERVVNLWALEVGPEKLKPQSLPLPVFGEAERAPDEVEEEKTGETALPMDQEQLETRLKARGIEAQFDSEGRPLSLFCPASRHRATAVFLLFFGAVWTTALVVMLATDAPLLFKIVWGISAPAIDIFAVWLLLHERRVDLSGSELRIDSRAGPFYSKREALEPRHIVQFTHDSNMRSGNQVFYRVRLETTFGKKITIIDGITEESTAAELSRRLMRWKQEA